MHGSLFRTAKLSKETSSSSAHRSCAGQLHRSKLSRGRSQPPARLAAETAQRVKDETAGAFNETSFAEAKQSLIAQETAASPSATEAQGPETRSNEANIPETSGQGGFRRNRKVHDNRDPITCIGKRTGPVLDFPYKEGDYVMGKVVWEDPDGRMGWRVELCAQPDILALMPGSLKPYTLKDTLEDFNLPPGAVGTVRMFQIDKVPYRMEYNGRGPILSARGWDFHVIWRRAEQIRQLHEEKCDTLAVSMRASNSAGLLGVWDGIPLFVPWKFVLTYAGQLRDSEKEAATARRLGEGKSYVRIVDVDAVKNRFVGNLVDAEQIRALQGCQIGDLMEGVVVSVKDYGVFLRMGPGHAVKGLLHVRNISQAHVTNVHQLFEEGEIVKAFLLDVDEKNQVEFSIMELESYPGEMLENREAAMAKAAQLENFWERHEEVRARTRRRDSGARERQGMEDSPFRPPGYKPGQMDDATNLDW